MPKILRHFSFATTGARGKVLFLCAACMANQGCVESFVPTPAPLFGVELSIEGVPIGPAIIDTGGGFEVMLREPFELMTVGTAEVVAFAGREVVDVTEGFNYSAGGWSAIASGAIVNLSICDCNGIGFFFFRKTGAVLEVDFAEISTAFLPNVPPGGVTIPFAPPPSHLPDFDTSFVEIVVESGGASRTLRGLLDTGTNVTLVRRGLLDVETNLPFDQLDATITQENLGTVAIRVTLFEAFGLPDVILGTDIMRAWADRWYFQFAPTGGTITAFDLAGTSDAHEGNVNPALSKRARLHPINVLRLPPDKLSE